MSDVIELPRFACPDWWAKIQQGRTPMADVPLNEEKAAKALAFFNRLRLPDVAGNPTLADACGDWFRDILCAFLASEDPETKRRLVWELLCMVPKKNSKTTYVAALGLTALYLEETHNLQMLIVAPSQNISERCFAQAAGMIRIDARLEAIFRIRDDLKTIYRRKTDTKLSVKTFDNSIMTGEIPALTIIDELHELGKKAKAAAVMQQIRGGGITMQGGQVLMITTQSDEAPAGIWKTELNKARAIRDGKAGSTPILLPVLYEFPAELQKNDSFWRNRANWHLVLPNINRSIDPQRLADDYVNNGKSTRQAEQIWVSQHLNIEIGLGLSDSWAGAEHWLGAEDEQITLETILKRCEAVVVGYDGGGLDDLSGLTILGREPGVIEKSVIIDNETVTIPMKRWLSVSYAWCHRKVLDIRKSIAANLTDFEKDGELKIVDDLLVSFAESVAIIRKIDNAGLLAGVAVDSEGPYSVFVDALSELGISEEDGRIVGVKQGFRLMSAIKSTELRLANGMLRHSPSSMMNWCVGNLKIETTATAIRATKVNAGDAKVDPVFSLFDAAAVMETNPDPMNIKSVFDLMTDDEMPNAEISLPPAHIEAFDAMEIW